MRTLKWILACSGLVLAGLAATVLVKTWTFRSRQFAVPAVSPAAIDGAAAIGRIARAIQIQTVSHDDPSQDDARSFVALRELIDTEFPLIHERLRRTIVHDSSLLYEWKGTDPGRPPIILTAHQDVVPAEPSEWKSDPFSGAVMDHVIWGRGTLDDKGSLFAILEATEHLLAQGFTPDRTVYLGFGHDEEAGTTGGMNGARSIAAHLKAAGVHAESELDEGGVVLDERFSMIEGRKLALIGVAEKGFMTLTITAPGQSGHAMMPPTTREVAIFTLARAISAVEHAEMPSSLGGIVGLTFDYLGPEMPFVQRLLFANRWLFGGLIRVRLERDPPIAAMLHTTVAPTVIHGGVKEQSLPASASVVINFRIIPGETSRDVIERVTRSIADPRVKVELLGGASSVVHEPMASSGVDSEGYRTIDRTIREVFPGAVVAPGLITGRTDSLYYKDVADRIYRFAPYLYRRGDEKGPHGRDEFIRTDDYLHMIQFYIRYLQRSASSVERVTMR